MQVLRLVVHGPTREPVLLLGEIEGDRCVPVFLRRPQADAIAIGPRGTSDLPLPQDVLLPVLRGVFTAVVVIDGDTRIPVLASDALAVAVREVLPIVMAEEILDAVGQPTSELFPDGAAAPPDEQVRAMRAFLDGVSPEDFADPPHPGP